MARRTISKVCIDPVPVGPLALAVAIVSGPYHNSLPGDDDLERVSEAVLVVDVSTPPDAVEVAEYEPPVQASALAPEVKSKVLVLVVDDSTPPLEVELVLEVLPAPSANGHAEPEGVDESLSEVVVVVELATPMLIEEVVVVAVPSPLA